MGRGWRRDWAVAAIWLAVLENLFLPKAVLAARVLAAESQLAICQERLESQGVRRHRFSESFRWLWVLLSVWWEDWQSYARLMQPATVKR